MTATLQANGKARKSLADQIDRLDRVLDGLAEGLNGAVADAVQTSTREALREAIIAVLTDPELRAHLYGTAPAPVATPIVVTAPPVPGLAARIGQAIKSAARVTAAYVGRVARGFKERVQAVARGTAGFFASFGLAWKFKRILFIGLGVGVLTAVVSTVGSHGFAATLSGIGAAISAVAVQVGLWVRRLLRFPAL